MSQKLRMILLIVIAGLIGICCLISVSYAYFTVNPIIINTKVVLPKEGSSIVLIDNKEPLILNGKSASPTSDVTALNLANNLNRLQIVNETNSTVIFKIYIVPTGNSKMPVDKLKFAFYNTTFDKPASGAILSRSLISLTDEQQSLITKSGYTSNHYGYQLGGSYSVFANSTNTYDLYLWVSNTINNIDKNSEFQGIILIVKE